MDRLDVRTVAAGRWRSILSTLGMDDKALSGKHCACPMCGGKDRFRFDDKDGRGTFFCSGCGAGDGVKLAMGITGQMKHPDMLAALKRYRQICTGARLAFGTHIVRPTSENIAAAIDEGYSLIALGLDNVFLDESSRACLAAAGRKRH